MEGGAAGVEAGRLCTDARAAQLDATPERINKGVDFYSSLDVKLKCRLIFKFSHACSGVGCYILIMPAVV